MASTMSTFITMLTEWLTAIWGWVATFATQIITTPLFAMGLGFTVAFVVIKLIKNASPGY